MRRATIGCWMFASPIHRLTIRCRALAAPAVDDSARQVDELPEEIDIIHEFSSLRNRDEEPEPRADPVRRRRFAPDSP